MDELGDLYELDGAVIYRVVAYREAAKSIRDSPVSVAQLAREGRATELRNVGKTLEEKIRALLETGDIPAAVKLRAKFPGELVRFTRLPGLGAKTARRIHDELGISTLEELRDGRRGASACATVSGLGPEGRAEHRRARSPSSRRRGRPSGCCCRPCSRSASRSSSTCARIRRPTASRSRAARAA